MRKTYRRPLHTVAVTLVTLVVVVMRGAVLANLVKDSGRSRGSIWCTVRGRSVGSALSFYIQRSREIAEPVLNPNSSTLVWSSEACDAVTQVCDVPAYSTVLMSQRSGSPLAISMEREGRMQMQCQNKKATSKLFKF